MKTYLQSKDKKGCYGCEACKEVCPKNCINMKEDYEGFLYPNINKQLCINCKLCEKVCPIGKTDEPLSNSIETMYAMWSKDDEVVSTSTSGGAFTAFSDYILDRDGVVFGAMINDNIEVAHRYAENRSGRDLFKGSKYVQSILGDTYTSVKKFLDKDKYVLFTGTSCQVKGLYSFLGEKYDKLYTIDFLCSGVPSPKIFKKFMLEMEKENSSTIKEFKFRTKPESWRDPMIYMKFIDKEIYMPLYKTVYNKLFANGYIIRPCCGGCKFASVKRCADISIGDFWGIENYKPHLLNDKGVSVVLLNNKKALDIFNEIKDNVVFEECNVDEANQYRLKTPPLDTDIEFRNKIFKYLDSHSLNKAEERFLSKPGIIRRVGHKIKKMLIK